MTARRYAPDPPKRPLMRGLLLFLLPLPLLAALLAALAMGQVGAVLANGLGFGLFMLGAVLARSGFRFEREYQRRNLARAPRLPLKTLGGLVVALAAGLTAFSAAAYGLFASLALGVATLIGYLMCYGLDPRRDKFDGQRVGVSADEVLSALEEGERAIQSIEKSRARLRNQELRSRLGRITAQAREILKGIEEDPKDLRRARKFLVVYLEGAQRVSEGYARTHSKLDSGELEDNFRRVLDSIEQVFAQQQERLAEDDALDLDVQIEVLQKQLQQEGVT
jgi:5-bromo-4-chloroindolyl phosphate hydrolysis protein